jgi:uncharacterized RDD family membrane protein YckC
VQEGELTRWGATPGKRSLGLRVIMDNGLPVTRAATLVVYSPGLRLRMRATRLGA